MKKNVSNSQLIEKIKKSRIKPSKDFKKNLFNSLEKELKGEKQFIDNFNLLNIWIMLKKTTAGILSLSVFVGILGAFNTSYADKKENVLQYVDSGIEMIADGVDFVNIFNDKEFIRLTGLNKEELKELNKGGTIVIVNGEVDKDNIDDLEIIIEKVEGEILKDLELDFLNDPENFSRITNVGIEKMSERELDKMIKSNNLMEIGVNELGGVIKIGNKDGVNEKIDFSKATGVKIDSGKANEILKGDIEKIMKGEINLSDEELNKMKKGSLKLIKAGTGIIEISNNDGVNEEIDFSKAIGVDNDSGKVNEILKNEMERIMKLDLNLSDEELNKMNKGSLEIIEVK